MHELSIAHTLVELASEALDSGDADLEGTRVKSLNLVVGALSCVSPDALEYCFELASEGSALEGATLRFRRLPVVIHCPSCREDVELPGIQSFRCPRCDTPSSYVRQGRELEIESLEIEPIETRPSAIETQEAETQEHESAPIEHPVADPNEETNRPAAYGEGTFA